MNSESQIIAISGGGDAVGRAVGTAVGAAVDGGANRSPTAGLGAQVRGDVMM